MCRAVVAVVVSSAVAGIVAVGSAGAQSPLDVTGSFTCDASTGLLQITFVLSNQAADPLTVTSAAVTSVAGAGALTVAPNPIPVGGTATAVAYVPGSTTGAVALDVSYTWGGGTGVATGSVLAAGGCVPRGTVTTSTSVAESATTAAAPAVRVRPSFTG